MPGVEFLFILVGWMLPLAAVIFVVTSLVRITRSLTAIQRELGDIREVLERDQRAS